MTGLTRRQDAWAIWASPGCLGKYQITTAGCWTSRNLHIRLSTPTGHQNPWVRRSSEPCYEIMLLTVVPRVRGTSCSASSPSQGQGRAGAVTCIARLWSGAASLSLLPLFADSHDKLIAKERQSHCTAALHASSSDVATPTQSQHSSSTYPDANACIAMCAQIKSICRTLYHESHRPGHASLTDQHDPNMARQAIALSVLSASWHQLSSKGAAEEP